MTQFQRPNADTLIGNYEDEGGGVSDIFQSINEESPSDVDYIISPQDPSAEVYVCGLTTAEDPLSNVNHTVRYRYSKNVAAGFTIDLLVELREGYVDEGTQGSKIADWTHSDIGATPVTAEQELSAGEAAGITDYTDLFLRFRFNKP